MARGLSPPVRGNRGALHRPRGKTGSIPARAGKPKVFEPSTKSARVYPRPCGETINDPLRTTYTRGLSPPVRGNRRHRLSPSVRRRSIPARAGKPHELPDSAPLDKVYPRPCGETRVNSPFRAPATGLSPPVRGNQGASFAIRSRARSIPARAGKPLRLRRLSFGWQVYPRPCGETALAVACALGYRGLSPPVRGNHVSV